MTPTPKRASGATSKIDRLAERQQVLEGLVVIYQRLVSTPSGASVAAIECAERCLSASYERLHAVQDELLAWGQSATNDASSTMLLFESEAAKLWAEIVALHAKVESAIRAERDEVSGVLRRLRETRRIADRYRRPSGDATSGRIVDASS